MKSITTFPKYSTAWDAVKTLTTHGIYSTVFGCVSRGYEILVRDCHESDARRLLEVNLDAS